MIIKYGLILGIAHVLGDFYFQTEKMARQKKEKYLWVLLHSLEYYMTAAIIIIPIFSFDLLIAATCLGLMHWFI